jgi:hypothetical protein
LKKKLFKNTFVVAIILLFIGLGTQPVLSDQITLFNPNYSNEISTNGYCINITKIVPYYDVIAPFWVVLYFTAKIKNTGNEPYTGEVGYFATAKNIHGKVVKTAKVTKSGGLNPNESWIDIYSNGLEFDGWYYPPRYYKLEFYSIPSNDYKMAKYKIYGDWHGYEYKEVNNSFSYIKSSNYGYNYLDCYPSLNILINKLRILNNS